MPYEATSQSIFQPFLKNMWHRGRVVDETMRDKPFLAMVPKGEDFFGDDQKVNVFHRNPMGRSVNPSKAQSNARSGRGVRFSVTRVSNHQSVFVQNETIESSKNDMGALLSVIDQQTKGAVNNLVNEIAFGLYRNGGGTRGRLSAAPTVGTPDYIQLTNAKDVKNFSIGMTLKCGTTDGATATTFRSTPSTAEITGIDRSNNRIYFAANTFTGTNWAGNDYLSVDGDIDESTFLGKYIKGLEAWVPSAAPGSSDSFFGVNRSQDVDLLAGLRLDARSLSLETGLIRAAADLIDLGSQPTHVFMSPRNYSNLCISLGSRIQYVHAEGSGDAARITFDGIVLPTPGGTVKIFGDSFCPEDVAWMTDISTWKWHTLNAAPKVNLKSGVDMLDPSTATDDVEMRWVYRGNLECSAPYATNRIQLA